MAYAVTARMRLIACGSMIPAHLSVRCVRRARRAHTTYKMKKSTALPKAKTRLRKLCQITEDSQMHMRRWLPAISIALFLTFLVVAPSAQALGGWLPSAPMAAIHTFASAVRLLDGRALVVGGNNNST